MKLTANVKRMFAALLVFVLVLTLLPMPTFAASSDRKADTIFFASDLHENPSNLKSLLKALAYEPGLVVLNGDHVDNTNKGSLASITSTIQSIYPGVQTFYAYAAHDKNVSADSSNAYAFASTGEVYTGEDYYVYAVDQDDMQSSSRASTASAAFVSGAKTADPTKVIFVVCHIPIHKRRSDNVGGAAWMSALNTAGQSHDIVYLWGHNHTGESSSDTSVYFVARGGSLTPQGGSTGTINFTYVNAGYIKNGYATMAQVNDDNVTFVRYKTSGSVVSTNTMTRLFNTHTHSWNVSETVDATCEAAGSVTYSCECGESYTEEIPTIGHTYTCVETEATCGQAGSKVYTCACGHSYSEKLEVEMSYVKVSSLSNGQYVITLVSGNKYYALSHKNNTISAVRVTVSNGEITSEITEDLIWTYSNNKLSYEDGGNTYYLYAQSSNSWWGWASTPTLTISTSNSTNVSISGGKVKLGSYYLRYSSGKISLNRSGTTAGLFKGTEN